MIILVSMSSMKSFYKKQNKTKKQGQAKRNGLTQSPFSLPLFVRGT